MQYHWWNHPKTALLSLLTILITACSSEEPAEIPSSLYIPQDIVISFPKQSTTLTESLNNPQTRQLHTTILQTLQQSYIDIQSPSIHYVMNGEESQGVITPENLAFSQFATLQLTPQKNGLIQVQTDDYQLCREISCHIEFFLKPVENDAPEIIALQNQPELPTIQIAPEPVPTFDITQTLETDFWGIEHVISDQLTLKLSPIQSNGLQYGTPEHTEMAAFDIGSLTINPEDPNIEILSFYSNAAPSSDVHQIDTISYLFIVPVNQKPAIDLATFDLESVHYYVDEENLLAKDPTGFYAINTRYFPEIHKIVVALTESLTLEDITAHFQSLNTLQITPNSKSVTPVEGLPDRTNILLTDITLPLKTLESRYDITLMQMFRIAEIQENYRTELKRLLTSEDLFLKTGPNTQNGYHLFTQHLGDYRFNETYLKIHADNVNNVLTAIQSVNSPKDSPKQPKDLWQAPIYFYSTDPKKVSGMSYLKEIQPGVTLEIFSPAYQGHIAEKVLFGKLLENIQWENQPKLSKKAIENITKYEALSDNNAPEPTENTANTQKQNHYEFKEGKTNLSGELLK